MSTVFEASYDELLKLKAEVERLTADNKLLKEGYLELELERNRLRGALEEIINYEVSLCYDFATPVRRIGERALAEGTKE